MKELKVSMGQKSFDEISNYISENYKESYSLSIYDILGEKTVEIECSKEEMIPAIMLATDMEHDFPEWIGINELTDSIVVRMNFTKGRLENGYTFKYKNRKFIKK